MPGALGGCGVSRSNSILCRKGLSYKVLIIGVASFEHRRKTGGLLFAPLFGAGLFEASAQSKLLQGLLAIQFFLEPADGLLDWFAFLQFYFSHN
jgi:hypothetical protein